ncbi:phage holin family protein [Prochlorococcus sp. MIT 1223]|uniref:phage holin family protein n=1 Tax=Prochlorococcus sp. MIT 1223 TaxID=3096217 RepID=UPI002A75102A|nr:phage holin family protein [Prochlorococcus sp. MIT 1223]
MTEYKSKKNFGAAARVTALANSIMDLHVRIALQEMDREKRRLISGGVFLALGGILMLFTLLFLHLLLGILMVSKLQFSIELTILLIAFMDVTLAGISLRVGGYLARGPYLPETLEGISKTTKAVLGKN